MKLKSSPGSVTDELDAGTSGFTAPPPSEFKLKKILVPVDFTPLSEKALRYAAAFAKQFGAEILLLHTVEVLPSGADLFQGLTAAQAVDLRARAAERLAACRDAVVAQAAVKATVLEGAPHQEILRVAGENDIDLIVIGTHARDGLLNHLLGGTTRRVVRHAPCPVLVVREHEHDFLPTERRSGSGTKQIGNPGKTSVNPPNKTKKV